MSIEWLVEQTILPSRRDSSYQSQDTLKSGDNTLTGSLMKAFKSLLFLNESHLA